MLGKVFKMAGLYKGQARQLEPDTHFRRALNVWQDKTGKWRPKGDQQDFSDPEPTDDASFFIDPVVQRTGFTRRFKEGFFSAVIVDKNNALYPNDPEHQANAYHYCDKNGTTITPYYKRISRLNVTEREGAMSRNSHPSTVVGEKLFFKVGSLPIQKFDGVQILRAGLSLPYIDSAQYTSGAATNWLKVVHARIGFDGRMIASGEVKFPVNATNVTIKNSAADFATELVGRTNVSPSFRDSPRASANYGDDLAWMIRDGGVAWTSTPTTLMCTATAHNLVVGQWVMFHYGISTFGIDGVIYALKVEAIAGLNITFSSTVKVYLKSNLSWVDRVFVATDAPFSYVGEMIVWSSIQQMVYRSSTENGTFLLCKMNPLYGVDEAGYTNIIPDITVVQPFPSQAFAGQTTSDIQGWYDISTVKISFPGSDTTYEGLKGLTTQKGLLIGHDDNAIYWSDATAGGSDEMMNGYSNAVPPGSEFGKIVCVEACEDFILISRERKNYILTGDVASGAFTIAEIKQDIEGAFSSNSAHAVGGGVVMVSRQGVYFVTPSGNTVEMTSDIDRLWGANREFDSDPDNLTFKPYKMSEAPSYTSGDFSSWDGNMIRVKHDASRGIVGILFAKRFELANPNDEEDTYAILGISLKTGAMYEWQAYSASDSPIKVHDFDFYPRYTAEGKYNGSLMQAGVTLTKEDISSAKQAKRYIVSSWQTGGEPSLEKQLKQVKFYGQMSSCRIFHQENWEGFTSAEDIVAPRTNVIYTQGPHPFEHKQRLNSSRAQSYSIGFEPLDENFSLEGFEIEWEMIQGGTKK